MGLPPVLLLHVCSGAVGLLAGTYAIVVREGGRGHAVSGIVFSLTMLSLAASGVYLACLKSQAGNIIGGAVTLYMISTAWVTGRFDCVLAAALAIGSGCLVYGARVASGAVSAHGVPAGMDFFFAFIILTAAVGDIRMLPRGGMSGRHRIARHLWRMCFGLFIASGSFIGRQRIFRRSFNAREY